tara:strand:- start:453 stop:971 length:519 start_codon:yes stop_codon:yes gene_type:complete
MSFWTESSLEPKRNFRFQIVSDGWAQTDESIWWWAKSIDKPSFEVSSNEYQLINHKFKYPGIVTWKNISITVVDVAQNGPNANESLEGELFKLGYSRPDEGAMKGIEKFSSREKTAAADLQIQHLDSNGDPVDTWTLKGAFITSATYSKLDYSSDDLSEVTLEIAYDYADYE